MTWFDGDPVNLWRHPPREEGIRYLECFGGVDALLAHAARYRDEKADLRFAATLLGHAVAAQPEHAGARAALADVLQRLGFGAENATWRNFYLTGAMELRAAGAKKAKAPGAGVSRMAALSPHLSVEHWLDALCIQLNGLRAGTEAFEIEICVGERDRERETFRLMLSNGALHVRKQSRGAVGGAGLCLSLTKAELMDVLRGNLVVAKRVVTGGDLGLLKRLFELTSPEEEQVQGEARRSQL